MENKQNEYGATACDRFSELISYDGENELLAYAARIMAQNFKLLVDENTGAKMLVDRVPDSEAVMVQSQEDARWRRITPFEP